MFLFSPVGHLIIYGAVKSGKSYLTVLIRSLDVLLITITRGLETGWLDHCLLMKWLELQSKY